MICIGYPCDKCKHSRENLDNWKCCCDAFPEGIPLEHYFSPHITEFDECNKGIGYEEKEIV